VPFLLELAWRDLRASGRRLWIFCACLILGVSLVAAGGGLYRQVADALVQDARELFGGDVQAESADPLPPEVVSWMRERGTVSRTVELRTMLLTQQGRSQLIELLSADDTYPLYGEVELNPPQALSAALEAQAGVWGAAIDRALAIRLDLKIGDRVQVGDANIEVRAIIIRQPDRSLRADWGAAPVLLADGAMAATGLIQPFSRVQYQYRVRTGNVPAPRWRDDFVSAFPALTAEVRSFDQRSDRMAEVLGQIASGLLLIGFAALFIGGLGVFNSVQAYLQSKLTSFATLRAIGLRDGRLATMVMLQVVMLGALAGLVGVVLGLGLALVASTMVAEQLPIDILVNRFWAPALVAWCFGLLTALVFSLPPLARALSVTPAVLFRGESAQVLVTPRRAKLVTAAMGALMAVLVVVVLPDPRFGLAFVVAAVAVLWMFEGVTRVVRLVAARLQNQTHWPLSVQLALAGLQQPHSPLRTALLSMGSALTVLVACTLVVMTLLRTVNDTVPDNAPALVFYDVQTEQIPLLRATLTTVSEPQLLRTAPFVLGRLVGVNGEDLRVSDNSARALESRDEHKLSDRTGNFDDVVIARRAWWPEGYRGPPLVAMEDREADELGLSIDDKLTFEILGQSVDATLVAIYSQRRMQSRLWLEAMFSDGVLDPLITRHVGAAWMPSDDTLAAQDRLALVAPNIATVRTESLLQETRRLMARASTGLVVVAGVCLVASLLVLASVVAASRTRQIYDATVMHALGARHSLLRAVLVWEYLLLALLTASLGLLVGSALAVGLMQWRLDMHPVGLIWTGAVTAFGVSVASLGLGARYLLTHMRLNPAMLLRSGG
jgi:putative ABC transport system permease protein